MDLGAPMPERSSRSSLQRYGPIGVIVVLLLGVGALVVLGGGDDEETATGGNNGEPIAECPRPDLDVDGEPGAPPPVCDMPITYDEAQEADTVDDYDWGEHCDPETGKLKIPTVYAPPCVPVFEGENGGDTYGGVTADKVTIVRFVPDPSGDFTSMLAGMGVDETPEDANSTFADYMEIALSRVETYGREVEVVRFQGSGNSNDEIASRAAAREIISDIRPFAVIGGPALDRGAFAQELADAGILCIGCGLALPAKTVLDNSPYMYGDQPSVDQFLATLAAWVNQSAEAAEAAGRPDAGTNAVFAGDPSFHDRARKVGVIHFEQDPPLFEVTASEQSENFERTYDLRETYIFDPSNLASLQEKAVDLIAKMKSNEITTILFLGDPIMPIYLTGQATAQEYFPEWIFTGTALTDTNVFGRNYNQEQMSSAYGLSQLGVPLPQELQTPWSLYKWYFGEDAEPAAKAQYALLSVQPSVIALGIHMAGPNLTPETFARGLFRVPPRGGGPTTPQVSYGNWGFHIGMDMWASDDSVEIWWDSEAEGTDEIGREGTGMWRYSRGGERFTRLDAPPPAPFIEEDTVTTFTELPEEDRAPDYPPPPGSPAASQ